MWETFWGCSMSWVPAGSSNLLHSFVTWLLAGPSFWALTLFLSSCLGALDPQAVFPNILHSAWLLTYCETCLLNMLQQVMGHIISTKSFPFDELDDCFIGFNFTTVWPAQTLMLSLSRDGCWSLRTLISLWKIRCGVTALIPMAFYLKNS